MAHRISSMFNQCSPRHCSYHTQYLMTSRQSLWNGLASWWLSLSKSAVGWSGLSQLFVHNPLGFLCYLWCYHARAFGLYQFTVWSILLITIILYTGMLFGTLFSAIHITVWIVYQSYMPIRLLCHLPQVGPVAPVQYVCYWKQLTCE